MDYKQRKTADEKLKLIDAQGERLNTLYNSVQNVKGAATGINQEITSQIPLIGKMGQKVEGMDNKLINKNQNLDVIIETENGWCGMWIYYIVVFAQIVVILIIIASWF